MYIIYSEEKPEAIVFEEDRQSAYDLAKGLAKEQESQFSVYKASLVAVTSLPTEVQIIKIRKQPSINKTVFKKALEKVAKNMEEAVGMVPVKQVSKKPVLDPDLQIITAEEAIQSSIPMGARCAFDNAMAVGKKVGPTGESVYLCMPCMGLVKDE
jgi:hypothetical protein